MGEAALHIDQVTHEVIGVAMRLHSEIGPGLLESVYETILAGRLASMGYKVDRQRPINVVFDGIEFREVGRADLVIDDRLVAKSNPPRICTLCTRNRFSPISGCCICPSACSSISGSRH
jgi:hypothetical protein